MPLTTRLSASTTRTTSSAENVVLAPPSPRLTLPPTFRPSPSTLRREANRSSRPAARSASGAGMPSARQPSFCRNAKKLSGDASASRNGNSAWPTSPRIASKVPRSDIRELHGRSFRLRKILVVQDRVQSRVPAIHEQQLAHVAEFAVARALVALLAHLAQAGRAVVARRLMGGPLVHPDHLVCLARGIEEENVLRVVLFLVDLGRVRVRVQRPLGRQLVRA